MGFRMIRATPMSVVEYDVQPKHLQPYGIVHGGVPVPRRDRLLDGGGDHRDGARKPVVGVETIPASSTAVAGRAARPREAITRGRGHKCGSDRRDESGRKGRRTRCGAPATPETELAGEKCAFKG